MMAIGELTFPQLPSSGWRTFSFVVVIVVLFTVVVIVIFIVDVTVVAVVIKVDIADRWVQDVGRVLVFEKVAP